MAQISFIQRRGAVYYFRQRVPKELLSVIGRKELVFSLKTKDKTEAKLRAAEKQLQIAGQFSTMSGECTKSGITSMAQTKSQNEGKLQLLAMYEEYAKQSNSTERTIDGDRSWSTPYLWSSFRLVVWG